MRRHGYPGKILQPPIKMSTGNSKRLKILPGKDVSCEVTVSVMIAEVDFIPEQVGELVVIFQEGTCLVPF